MRDALKLVRLGTAYGGFEIPDDLAPGALCYCGGAGEDVSFELALIRDRGARVVSFDPTPRAAAHVASLREYVARGEPMPINGDPAHTYAVTPPELERFTFEPWGLWSSDTTQRFFAPTDPAHVSHSILNLQGTDEYFDAECRSLASAMRALGHAQLDLLKLNIEGAELAVLEAMLEADIRPRVLCISFEAARDAGAARRTLSLLARLRARGWRLAARRGFICTLVRDARVEPVRETRRWLGLGARIVRAAGREGVRRWRHRGPAGR